MKFTKLISSLLALGTLLLFLTACQTFSKTQLVLFESLSFYMPTKSFEEAFGEPNEVVEETATGYRDTWHAEAPYLYKTGRLFYNYDKVNWKNNSGRAIFTFSKSHRLQEATIYFPMPSKAQQKEIFYHMTQDIKAEIEALPNFQSLRVDALAGDDVGYRFKVKLKGQREELWVDVYPIENEYVEKPEVDKYPIRVDQFRMYPG